MINCWHVFLFLWLSTSSFAEAVNCSLHVQPTTTVVVVGERVSLNCTVTSGDFSIISWQLGTDVKNKTVVYSAPQFGPNATVKRNQSVADGYSVTNTADHTTTSLLINHINISQSGLYVCHCDDSRTIATTPVVVLASEPQFVVIPSIATTGKPVSFSCNISFNGSADISSNLIIKDIYGTTVNITVCYSNNRLTSCSVEHTTIANASVDQSYKCSVQLISNTTSIYSRILNTSVEWKQVTSAEIVMSNPNKCYDGKCVVNESITCKTDGNHETISYTWWQIQDNGSKLDIGNNKQTLVLTKIGRFKYQCQVYSIIRRANYNTTSKTFTVDVAANDSYYGPSSIRPMPVVIGISAAIGIIIVVIAIVVACICYSRRRTSRRISRATMDNSSVSPPQKHPTNRYDKTKPKPPDQQQVSHSTASNQPAAPNNSKTLDNNELTLFDNVMYGETKCASPNSVVPPVVSIPEENIYNEINHNAN